MAECCEALKSREEDPSAPQALSPNVMDYLVRVVDHDSFESRPHLLVITSKYDFGDVHSTSILKKFKDF